MPYLQKCRKFYNTDGVRAYEMIGMPASGKTTFVKEYMNKNKTLIYMNTILPKSLMVRWIYKIYFFTYMLIIDYNLLIKDIRIVHNSKQKSINDLIVVLFNWIFVTYAYKRFSKCKYEVIFDQGIFQAIWSIMYSATEFINMDDLLKGHDLPCEVYLFDLDNEILKSRAGIRNTTLRIDYSNNNQIKHARGIFNMILMYMVEHGYKEKSV